VSARNVAREHICQTRHPSLFPELRISRPTTASWLRRGSRAEYLILKAERAVEIHSTTIRQLPHNIVVIPNAKLASGIVANYDLPAEELAVLVQVGVSYESDLEKVERVTVKAAHEATEEVQGGAPGLRPLIR
jgi:hypothetical protein